MWSQENPKHSGKIILVWGVLLLAFYIYAIHSGWFS